MAINRFMSSLPLVGTDFANLAKSIWVAETGVTMKFSMLGPVASLLLCGKLLAEEEAFHINPYLQNVTPTSMTRPTTTVSLPATTAISKRIFTTAPEPGNRKLATRRIRGQSVKPEHPSWQYRADHDPQSWHRPELGRWIRSHSESV
jgi:hypothetical protein